MITEKTVAKCTAGAIILAGFVALGGLFGPVAAMADARPPASASTTPSIPQVADPAPAIDHSELRRAFLTEMQTECVKVAQARGAPASIAVAFCGCLTQHAATLPSAELEQIAADPTILEPQIRVCRAQVTAPAQASDATPPASASTTPSIPQVADPAPATFYSEFTRSFYTEMQRECTESLQAGGTQVSVAMAFCGCMTRHVSTLSFAEIVRIGFDPTILEPQVRVCVAQVTEPAQ
ncbi:hypothetical protein [Phreatobacter sp.]|uniref:hypothetical protein n=1 Tax=Phreatobacter sp. TaxID=1966341 RepID=UPI003F70E56B